jgi:GT2 family glycosyltransferase
VPLQKKIQLEFITNVKAMNATTLSASVVVCTYNRAESLKDTLAALQQQIVQPEIEWEIIVVDNNSKDETRELVEAARRSCPRIRYEFEGKQGLSHARNHGVACAAGEIILFTDDDACPEPDWLATVLQGMRAHQSAACGGYIAPIWEESPPAWLTERFFGFLAVRTERSDTYPITSASEAPFGANMAFRKDVFARVGLFDVRRGRNGTVLSSGEDGELFERILARGLKVMFFGDARVRHKVDAVRLTKQYFRRWRFQASRNIAMSQGFPGRRRVLGIPLYLFPQTGRALVNAVKARLRDPADEAFNREIIVWHFFGALAGLLSANRSRNKS